MRRKRRKQEQPLLEQMELTTVGGAPAMAKTKGEWAADDAQAACSGCEKGFTLKRRRHHCRHCGGLFCSDCCSTKHKRQLQTEGGGGSPKSGAPAGLLPRLALPQRS